MSKIPVISGEELIRVLRRYGFWVEKQKGTLKRILRDAGISVERLNDLFREGRLGRRG